jgi:hypothetical protein
MVVDDNLPTADEACFHKENWTEFHREAEENNPLNDFQTGILMWYSKKQNMVPTSTFCSNIHLKKMLKNVLKHCVTNYV